MPAIQLSSYPASESRYTGAFESVPYFIWTPLPQRPCSRRWRWYVDCVARRTGDKIWVAMESGRYVPFTGSGNRNPPLSMTNSPIPRSPPRGGSRIRGMSSWGSTQRPQAFQRSKWIFEPSVIGFMAKFIWTFSPLMSQDVREMIP